MLRRFLAVPVLLLGAACQPQQPPRTAAPAAPQGSIDLPAAEAPHRYDNAIKPGDDTPRRAVAANRSVAPARPPANALTEREKAAIDRWDREEAALSYDAPPIGLRPPPTTRVALAMPTDASLPRPSSEKTAPAKHNDAALPPPVERPEPVAASEPVKASEPAQPPVPPPPAAEPAPPAVQPEPAPVAAPPPAVESAPPRTRAAAAAPLPAEQPLPRPGGEPAATVIFSVHSAEISDGTRLLLEHFAKDANARRTRQILLFGYAGDGDPVEARKLALARVLAVHAALIDLGLKANIEIGDFSQANEASPDRVDVMLRN
jgi:outer membrane protein OmpA-like peptidoglycan-associated protein